MTKIIKTIAFLLVLTGLLALGVSTLAKAPTTSSHSRVLVFQGHVETDGTPITPDMVREGPR